MKIIECDQYSPEWWSARRGVPTASEFGKVLTPAKMQIGAGAQTYINELIASEFDPFYGVESDYATAAMRNGSIVEPEVRRLYEFESGAKVEQVGFCLTDDGRFGCSPDGLVGTDGGVEIKSPLAKTQVAYLRDGGLPQEYVMQVHGCLLITGRAWWDFISHCPGTSLPSLRVRVEPNAITEALRSALDVFWTMYQEAKRKIVEQVPVEAMPERETKADYWC